MQNKNTKKQTELKSVDWQEFKRLMIRDLLTNNIVETFRCGTYTLEQINQALQYPHNNGHVLLDASEYLMRISPQYRQINRYFANMATFDWSVDVYDVKQGFSSDKLKSSYAALCSHLEKMNIKHELNKIMQVLPYQDIFYGVICEGDNDFFIQPLPYRMCQLYAVQDGIYNFKIDLNQINAVKIDAYPKFIQQAYLAMQKQNQFHWYIPPSDLQCCFKLNEHLTYPYPLLISIVKDIFDLDIYKKLKLQKARTDNYKALVVEVPIDENSVDKPLLTPETLGVFAEMNKPNMPEDIGLLHTLGTPQAISFKDNNNSRNNVADATSDLYSSAGVPQILFSGDSAAGTALSLSIENDGAVIYNIYRQMEVWFNRFIKLRKYNKPSYKFSLSFLDATVFNKDKVIDRYIKAGQNGLPVKGKLAALFGLSPSKIEGSLILENEILEWHNKWIPLSSSYTQSGEQNGRPTNESKNITSQPSGEQTQNNDSNNKR